jgi:SNF2 family DNA or RNA helicase
MHINEIIVVHALVNMCVVLTDSLDTMLAPDADPGAKPIKVVVFSQWTSMLDLVEVALRSRGAMGNKGPRGALRRRLDASTTKKQRPVGTKRPRLKEAVTVATTAMAVEESNNDDGDDNDNEDEDEDAQEGVDRVNEKELDDDDFVEGKEGGSHELDGERFRYARLDGTMSQANRATAVSSFNADPSIRILLISLRAGGVGLNLVSASRVIIIEPWWNGTVEEQGIDRVHRLGQTRDVEVYRLICKDTIEERLLDLQEVKRRMSQQAIGTEEGSAQAATKLSLDDLRSLLA